MIYNFVSHKDISGVLFQWFVLISALNSLQESHLERAIFFYFIIREIRLKILAQFYLYFLIFFSII